MFIKAFIKEYTDGSVPKKRLPILVLIVCGFLFISLATPVLAFFSLPSSPTSVSSELDDISLDVLVSNRYILVQNDEIYRLEEGYEIFLRGVGSNNAWIEFQNNISSVPRFVGDAVLKEGDTIHCYRNSGSEKHLIMTMTLDKIFINNFDAILGFSDIYQYRDPYFSNFSEEASWTIEVNKLTRDDQNNASDSVNSGDGLLDVDLISQPIYVIAAVCIVFVTVILVSLFFKKRIPEDESKE